MKENIVGIESYTFFDLRMLKLIPPSEVSSYWASITFVFALILIVLTIEYYYIFVISIL